MLIVLIVLILILKFLSCGWLSGDDELTTFKIWEVI